MTESSTQPSPEAPDGTSSDAATASSGSQSDREGSERPSRRGGKRVARAARWLRRSLILVICLAVVAGAALWVITRSWFIIAQVRPELEKRLGGPIAIGRATYEGDGQFIFHNVQLDAPGFPTAGARVFEIARIELKADLQSLTTSSPIISSVRLEGARMFLNEAADEPGRFNFMSLEPNWSAPPGDPEQAEPMLLPEVHVINASLEVGVVDDDGRSVLGTRRVSGHMFPSVQDKHELLFELVEIDERGNQTGDSGLRIKGRWNVATNEHETQLDSLVLDDRAYAMLPSSARQWWDRMALSGRVSKAAFGWTEDEPLSVRFDVHEVDLTLPIDNAGFWARYRDGRVESTPSRPRLHVERGQIILQPDSAQLVDLKGELHSGDADDAQAMVSVPYVVNMRIPSIAQLQGSGDGQPEGAGDSQQTDDEPWLDGLLGAAAFNLDFRLDDFSIKQRSGQPMPAVDLPRVVADALQRFEMRDWSLSTNISIWREPPTTDEQGTLTPQPIQSRGQAFVRNASCRYDKFPYPLQDVEGFIRFDHKSVDVEYLQGSTTNGRVIRLAGHIEPLDRYAGVELHLTGTSIAIDQTLRSALVPQSQKVFDTLLHQPSYDALAESGLLLDRGAIDQLRVERRTLRAARERLAAADEVTNDQAQRERTRIDRRLQQINRLIEAGPFALGGGVDLDLHIRRPIGPDQRTIVEGEVTVHNAGVVFEYFPYPLHVQRGRLQWSHEAVTLISTEDEPFEFTTPGGGIGIASGGVSLPRIDGKIVAQPNIAISVRDDAVNDLILHAIPDRTSRNGEVLADAADEANTNEAASVSHVLRELGLVGALSYHGLISPDELDPSKSMWDFQVALADGAARPSESLAQVFDVAGLHWPRELTLDDLNATLRVQPREVAVTSLVARHESGRVLAQGKIAFKDASRQQFAFDVEFQGLPVKPWLVSLAPSESAEPLAALWDRYEPAGVIDAHVRLQQDADDGSTSTTIDIHPTDVTLSMNDQPVRLEHAGGGIAMRSGQLQFDALRFGVVDPADATRAGEITLEGSYAAAGDSRAAEGGLNIGGRWQGGRFDSPIIAEVLRRLDMPRIDQQLATLEPAGAFDAAFEYASPGESAAARFELRCEPAWLEANIGDTRVRMDIKPGAKITLNRSGVRLSTVSARVGDGVLDVEGDVRLESEATEIDLNLDFAGSVMHPQALALLPAAVRTSLSAIKLEESAAINLSGGRLTMRMAANDEAEASLETEAHFDGRVTTSKAAMTAGIDFSEVDGAFDVHFDQRPGAPVTVSLKADVDRMLVMGRQVEHFSADLDVSPDGASFDVTNGRGDCFGGAVSAEATVGLTEDRPYEVRVDLVGVGLDGLYTDLSEIDIDLSTAFDTRGAQDLPPPPDGRVFGGLVISGSGTDDDARRVGRGTIRIIDGAMARMPVTLRLMQLIQLMPPVNESFEYCDARFYIEDDWMMIEHISLECPTLHLTGDGRMRLDDYAIDLSLQPRGTVALWSDLVGGLTDTLYRIHVTGTLRDPEAAIQAAPVITTPAGNTRINTQRARADIDDGDTQRIP